MVDVSAVRRVVIRLDRDIADDLEAACAVNGVTLTGFFAAAAEGAVMLHRQHGGKPVEAWGDERALDNTRRARELDARRRAR